MTNGPISGRETENEIETEAEAEAEAEAVNAARIPVSEPQDIEADNDQVAVDDDENSAAEEDAAEPEPPIAPAVPAAPTVPAAPAGVPIAEQDKEAASKPVPSAPDEGDDTTLIPRLQGHRTEATAAMPVVESPQSDMARRPHSATPDGNGSARQRSQLSPLQNLKLDRRELDAQADAGGEGGGPRHLRRRALLVGGGVAVAATAGLAAAGVIKPAKTAPKVPTVGFAVASNAGASPATQTGGAFLAAWQTGAFEVAANLTDNPAAALAALKAYDKNLGVVGMVMNPNAANAVGWMTFAVTTQAGTPMGQWLYDSGFATYSKQIEGYTRWFVKWDPSILYSSLKPGYQLAIKKTPASVKNLVDRNNQAIDPGAHPSLAGIVNTLMSKAVATGATDGQDIVMNDAEGNQLATVATLTKPIDNGSVSTTLDMSVQSAAESAVPFHSYSSIVAIKPSTGHILAIANNTTSQYLDDATQTRVAPGSTFKIITSTALLSKGLTTLNSDVPCPPAIKIDGQTLKNSEGEAGDHTYQQDFAESCNNAFSSFWDASGMTGDLLADTAATYYGLNQKWDIGLGQPTQYMQIPTGLSRGGLAESLVGQGDVVACPLAMCSVAATVASGAFKQPILLPKQTQLTATPLSSSLQGQIKELMASVVAPGGTAAGVGFPVNGHFYGKTGTAEVGSGPNLYNNSWFVVFDDQHDIAVCALAIRGGAGATTAARECFTVFKKLGYV